MTQTTYQIQLHTDEPGEDGAVIHGTYTLILDTQAEANAAFHLLRIAIDQGARCGKVSVANRGIDWNTLTDEQMEAECARENKAQDAWDKLNLPLYTWITGIKSYQRVTTEDLPRP